VAETPIDASASEMDCAAFGARQQSRKVLHLQAIREFLVGASRLIFDRLASTLLFGLAANGDNLTIGVAYGMKHRRIRWRQNLFIAIVTTLVTLVAMALGRQIRDLLPSKIPDILGGALLLVFATWNFYRERTGLPNRPSSPTSRWAEQAAVGMGECLFLAGTLSINNLGLAIAGGIDGVRYISAACSIFFFSVAMLALGQAAGGNFAQMRSVSQVLRYPMSGNAVLALAGVVMLAGY
jgi:putative Mn2+ efflux pump MntP